ncbi:IS110 family transposase [Deinococcus apachensis]|uniref:IS110 family transposase n=1 Tax=Deinococcus apachensis TaxID=309886 RepID=UPI001FE082DA|nr:IS110 family transposase [Deinococcus apachensis]
MFVLGLDVGKTELYACLLRVQSPESPTQVGAVKAVANTARGHEQLLVWLTKSATVDEELSVVMESTRVYWERMAMTLHDAGCAVSVVKAAQIKDFAKSTLRRGKKAGCGVDCAVRGHHAASVLAAPRSRPGRAACLAPCS